MATPTWARQQLGSLLRDLRLRRDVTVERLVLDQLQSASTVSRHERGHTVPSWDRVQALLAYLGATDDERAAIEHAWEVAATEPAPVSLPAGMPRALRRLIHAERDGDREQVIAPSSIPSLLQTPDYIRTLNNTSVRYAGGQVSHNVQTQLDRQTRLSGPHPLTLHTLIDESVLYQSVGDTRIMLNQLHHLLTLSELPHVTIQVVTFTSGPFASMPDPSALVFYADSAGAYLQYHLGGVWVENENNIRTLRKLFDDIADVALTPDESQTFIDRHIDTLKGMR